MEGKRKRKLSVAIITFNEEKNISDCIQSVLPIASEIVVLDSFSSDATESIAKSFPLVRFYQSPFPGHVEQKNKAIAYCKEEWILSLDADERLDKELCASIEAFLGWETVPESGFLLARLTYHLGRWIRHSGWYPQRRIRLFRKGKAVWSGENPHDFLVLEKGLLAGKLEGNILHYSFTDLSHQIQTINQFSSIVAFTRFEKKKSFFLFASLLKPVGKFLEIYIFKRGFLDGVPGLFIALTSAFSTFLKYAKIYELEKGYRERPSNLRKDYGQTETKK